MLLDAHIDEIGMIVTYITEDGFLKISGCSESHVKASFQLSRVTV